MKKNKIMRLKKEIMRLMTSKIQCTLDLASVQSLEKFLKSFLTYQMVQNVITIINKAKMIPDIFAMQLSLLTISGHGERSNC